MTSRSSPWTFSRFFTNSPTACSSSSRVSSASYRRAKSASACASALQRALDLALLRLGERDDADRQPGLARAAARARARRSYAASPGFARRRYTPRRAVRADAAPEQRVDPGRRHLARHDLGRPVRDVRRHLDDDVRPALRQRRPVRDRGQPPAVERGVAERDQRLVPAAVVPGQHRRRAAAPRSARGSCRRRGRRRSRRRRRVDGSSARRRRPDASGDAATSRVVKYCVGGSCIRSPTTITCSRAVHRRHGLLDRDLARLVEDHDVEQPGVERQRVRDRRRAHQPDRPQRRDDARPARRTTRSRIDLYRCTLPNSCSSSRRPAVHTFLRSRSVGAHAGDARAACRDLGQEPRPARRATITCRVGRAGAGGSSVLARRPPGRPAAARRTGSSAGCRTRRPRRGTPRATAYSSCVGRRVAACAGRRRPRGAPAARSAPARAGAAARPARRRPAGASIVAQPRERQVGRRRRGARERGARPARSPRPPRPALGGGRPRRARRAARARAPGTRPSRPPPAHRARRSGPRASARSRVAPRRLGLPGRRGQGGVRRLPRHQQLQRPGHRHRDGARPGVVPLPHHRLHPPPVAVEEPPQRGRLLRPRDRERRSRRRRARSGVAPAGGRRLGRGRRVAPPCPLRDVAPQGLGRRRRPRQRPPARPRAASGATVAASSLHGPRLGGASAPRRPARRARGRSAATSRSTAPSAIPRAVRDLGLRPASRRGPRVRGAPTASAASTGAPAGRAPRPRASTSGRAPPTRPPASGSSRRAAGVEVVAPAVLVQRRPAARPARAATARPEARATRRRPRTRRPPPPSACRARPRTPPARPPPPRAGRSSGRAAPGRRRARRRRPASLVRGLQAAHERLLVRLRVVDQAGAARRAPAAAAGRGRRRSRPASGRRTARASRAPRSPRPGW